ncbi:MULTISPECIES: class E sortase [unclassified Streptomyces]|uniref:class E sortase n=1 Tax=unclassified Streptomyces TaxID=2593676 RepID=UPI00225B1144|nr:MULTISPECIES: class E sortase [unclassified Streptomyces]MCX4882119.1 class E sortase [Streptomyces sp. NBC_00847]MCX5422151.1 class E sortase [Streptomyces sp. NBC_00078]
MTALRPERESGASYGQEPYEASGAFEASGPYEEWGAGPAGQHGAYAAQEQPYASPAQEPYVPPAETQQFLPPIDDETVALRIPDPPPDGSIPPSGASTAAAATGTTPGGRAARRKAAKRRHGRHGGTRTTSDALEEGAEEASADASRTPLSRVEARRQARARKASPAVVASRAIGEVFITTGVLMLLFVTYQLWWTNVRAHAAADKETSTLQNDWASGKRAPGTFEPGQGFAILHIPELDVVVPIAEGVSNKKVLDKGMVGHYSEGKLKTAMPGAKTGNFALAGHRNTHGEPFRYINKLKKGDEVVVETQDKYYVYKMTSVLPVTSPSNTSVIGPVPPQSGFTGPGRYITLTTCTPEFTSKYRLIVWGKMVEERPRSKGKPDALVE